MTNAAEKKLSGKSLMPSITVDDLQKSMKFFEGLGFEIEDRWEQEGELRGVGLKAGNVHLGLSQDDGKKGTNRTKGVGMRLYIEITDNIDAAAARAKSAGVTLVKEPHDTDWGTRQFEVQEPSGFMLTISSAWA